MLYQEPIMPVRKSKSTTKENGSSIVPDNMESAMPSDLKQYVTTKQAAEKMGVDPAHASHLVKTGKLKGIKLGHDWIVFVSSIFNVLRLCDQRLHLLRRGFIFEKRHQCPTIEDARLLCHFPSPVRVCVPPSML